ncbi:MAG: 3-phosphoshikimate 1-carboxyvinyltransferase [Gaiellaceae bacterium]
MRIEPATSVQGALAVPGAKSISHRALLLAALAQGESEIRGYGRAGDTLSTISALRALGVEVREADDTVRVTGAGLRGLQAPDGPIDCGNAGTLLRLLAGILAGQEGTFTLTGDESLRGRPMERIAEPLRLMGADVETTGGTAPLRIRGSRLSPIRYELPVASAQVKSAVLLAGLYATSGPTTVVEPAVTRDHTERLLSAAGVRVAGGPREASVWPAERLEPLSLDVPGDFSSAAPFLVAATLLSGSVLRLAGVNVNPTRIGFLPVLERMGARISLFNRRQIGGEPGADVEVASSELTATAVGPAEVPLLVDELPLFALAAACARGESLVRGAEELRVKESDRIETITEALRAAGVRIRATEDGFRVRGVPARPRGGRVHARGDHRIAMLGAVTGLVSREGVQLEDAESVAISFPGFFDLLRSIAL